jgi:hypothetical protein
VPITPFLQGKVFDPEALAALNAVFVDVCERLRLTDKADPATRLVAQQIIELASSGEYDREGLRRAAYHQFNIDS